MKILIVLLTHDKYEHLINPILNRINELEIPENCEVDKLIITDDTQEKVINFANVNNFPIETTSIDLSELKNYNTDPRYTTPSGFTFKTFFIVCKLRNYYLKIAREGKYDWLLQIDGDVLFPKDGLVKLFRENKKYIGAAIESKQGGKYVVPDKTDQNEVYECELIGNCFHLEHSSCFDIEYTFPDNYPVCADVEFRAKELRKKGIKMYCHPLIKCEHLE